MCTNCNSNDYFDTFCRSRSFMIVNLHFLSHSRPSNSCSNSLTTKTRFQLYWTALTRHKPTRRRRSAQSFDMPFSLSAPRARAKRMDHELRAKKSRGGHSHKLDTIQEHKVALMLYGYKIIAPMKNVMSPFLLQ